RAKPARAALARGRDAHPLARLHLVHACGIQKLQGRSLRAKGPGNLAFGEKQRADAVGIAKSEEFALIAQAHDGVAAVELVVKSLDRVLEALGNGSQK